MADEPKPHSFWTTLPGVITALTGLIAALTALVTGLHKAGLLGNPSADRAPPAADVASEPEREVKLGNLAPVGTVVVAAPAPAAVPAAPAAEAPAVAPVPAPASHATEPAASAAPGSATQMTGAPRKLSPEVSAKLMDALRGGEPAAQSPAAPLDRPTVRPGSRVAPTDRPTVRPGSESTEPAASANTTVSNLSKIWQCAQ